MGVTNDRSATIFFTGQKAKNTSQTSSSTKGLAQTGSEEEKRRTYKLIAERYNIRKASYHELGEMTDILCSEGIITCGEQALILFNPEIAPPEYIRLNYPNYRYFLTETDSEGRRDWLQEFEARIKKNYADSNPFSANYRERLLTILRKLERK